jgi:hypothetical protein
MAENFTPGETGIRKLGRLFLLLAVVLAPINAGAVPLSNSSLPLASINLSGTVSVTNTFQSIQGQTNNRQGCTIQNNGTHSMYAYFGACANATTRNSALLNTGQSLFCSVGGNTVLIDQVCITGTAGDVFYANFQ